ncbi:hypothetical protein QL285_042221 [Trifolium repens]|nr:hypothetical protein QL285_042221 [Trifolium repens]
MSPLLIFFHSDLTFRASSNFTLAHVCYSVAGRLSMLMDPLFLSRTPSLLQTNFLCVFFYKFHFFDSASISLPQNVLFLPFISEFYLTNFTLQ